MKNLDEELVFSAKKEQRTECGQSVIYLTDKGVLTLTRTQEDILLIFSGTQKLLDLS